MEIPTRNNSGYVSSRFQTEYVNSKYPSDLVLPGAKDLGERLITTVVTIAKTTAEVNEERVKACKEIFDSRNLANREWQLLDKKGRDEREACKLETKRVLSNIALEAKSNIRQNVLDKQRYTEEVKRLKEEEVGKVKMKEVQLQDESRMTLDRLQEQMLHYDCVKNKELSDLRESNSNEVKLVNEKAKTTIAKMEEYHRQQIEEIKKESNRRENIRKEKISPEHVKKEHYMEDDDPKKGFQTEAFQEASRRPEPNKKLICSSSTESVCQFTNLEQVSNLLSKDGKGLEELKHVPKSDSEGPEMRRVTNHSAVDWDEYENVRTGKTSFLGQPVRELQSHQIHKSERETDDKEFVVHRSSRELEFRAYNAQGKTIEQQGAEYFNARMRMLSIRFSEPIMGHYRFNQMMSDFQRNKDVPIFAGIQQVRANITKQYDEANHIKNEDHEKWIESIKRNNQMLVDEERRKREAVRPGRVPWASKLLTVFNPKKSK